MDRLRKTCRKPRGRMHAIDPSAVLQGAAVFSAFFALAGTAGAVDMDTVGPETYVAAAVLLGISLLLWYISYRLSNRWRRRERSTGRNGI